VKPGTPQALKRGGRIGKPERHPLELKKPIPGDESCFLDVTFIDWDLPIAPVQVYSRKEGRSIQTG
jgi:hypothetical protein